MKWGNLQHGISALFVSVGHVISEWKWLLWTAVLFGFCAATIVSLTHSPTYQARSVVEVQYADTLESFDSIPAKSFYQTQYELLKSDVLTEQLIAELDLETLFAHYWSQRLFSQSFFELKYWFVQQLNIQFDLKLILPKVEDSYGGADHYLRVLDFIKQRLTIETLPEKQQLIIHFRFEDPVLAPLMTDTLAQKLILLHQKHYLNTDFNIVLINSADVTRQPLWMFFFKALTQWLGGLLSLIFAFILLRSFWDDRVRTPEEVQQCVGLKVLGIAPKVKALSQKALALKSFNEPHSETANAFRFLQHSLLDLSQTQKRPLHLLQMTSSLASEGKTTSSINLACSYARAGQRVLLLDADLRRPAVHRYLDLANVVGLSSYLSGEITDYKALLQRCVVPNLHLISSGPIPTVAIDLLSSGRVDDLLAKLVQEFDLVIVDSPPVIHLGDALILSHKVDATLFTVAAAKTSQAIMVKSLKRLLLAKGHLAGVVLSHYVAKKKPEQTAVFMLEAS